MNDLIDQQAALEAMEPAFAKEHGRGARHDARH
jgi:hypothetical protein